MNENLTPTILAQSGQQTSAPFYMQMLMFVPMIVIFYVLMIRPQQKKAKALQELIKQIKPGDKVITASGIIGTVISVKERSLSLRSADTKMEILKSAVAEVTERSGETTTES